MLAFLQAFPNLIKVKMKAAQSCLPLCNPMDYTVHGMAKNWTWLSKTNTFTFFQFVAVRVTYYSGLQFLFFLWMKNIVTSLAKHCSTYCKAAPGIAINLYEPLPAHLMAKVQIPHPVLTNLIISYHDFPLENL